MIELVLVAGEPSAVRLGRPGEAKRLPSSMEVGDALRYEGVQQRLQLDGAYAAALPVELHCVDAYDNPVRFPPMASLHAAIDFASGQSDALEELEAVAMPSLRPPLAGLPCGGEALVALPPSRLVGGDDGIVFAISIWVAEKESPKHPAPASRHDASSDGPAYRMPSAARESPAYRGMAVASAAVADSVRRDGRSGMRSKLGGSSAAVAGGSKPLRLTHSFEFHAERLGWLAGKLWRLP